MAYDSLASMGIPVVLTAHGVDIEIDSESGHGFRLRPNHDRRVRDLVKRAACLTAISPSIKTRYLELGVAPACIREIPNGVDFERFDNRATDRSAVRSRHGLPLNRSLVLTVGRDRPAKGHLWIPPALKFLLQQGHKISWVILGGDAEKMHRLARAEGVEDHLLVLPAVLGNVGAGCQFPSDDVIDLYKAADVFALPSLSEGFGLAAVEAMAANLPVVATNVTGLCDIVRNGKNGLLCPPADPMGMALAIKRVIDDASIRSELVEAARETARNYDWRSVSARYLDLYRDLIERVDR